MDLTFLLPERAIKTQARVCYLGRFEGGARVGVQFGELSAEARLHWQKWCTSLNSPAEAAARGGKARSEACVLALASALPSEAMAALVDGGCRVSLATDAAAALRTLSKGHTDVLISDVRRPDLDGRALCELVRRTRSLSGVHVILLTGRGEVVDPGRGLDVGATYVFTQPVDPEQLLSVIALCQRS
jgi:CheY-like chemotaxis protein